MNTSGDLRGILLMLGAMAAFAVEDMLLKSVTDRLSIGQTLLIMGGCGAIIFGILSWRAGDRLLSKDLLHRLVVLRNLSEMLGTICFITAFTVSTLSMTSAILQATPLIVTMGAALFLGEAVGWRRWSAILVGFIGVMMIVRPGMAGFEPASLLAVAGAIFLSIRDLSTRTMPARIGTLQLSTYAFAITGLAGLGLMLFGAKPLVPTGTEIAALSGAILVGVVGYYMIIQSMRSGSLSVIAPFRYARLIFALIIGVSVFGERPDFWTLAGSAVIIGSGLYTFARERRTRREVFPVTPPAAKHSA